MRPRSRPPPGRRPIALAAALAALLGACRCERPPPPSPEPAPTAAAAPASRGVKVPLADGWSARLGKEQSLTVGPSGRAVLRIDLRPGAAASKPGSAELLAMFKDSLEGGGTVAPTALKDQDGFSWVTFQLSARPLPDGGRPGGEPALLGAKALGDDLFLCATLPGATEAEVESAARACEGISYSAGP